LPTDSKRNSPSEILWAKAHREIISWLDSGAAMKLELLYRLRRQMQIMHIVSFEISHLGPTFGLGLVDIGVDPIPTAEHEAP